MRKINKTAKKTFLKIADGLNMENTHRKIDNTNGAFMAVSVNFLYHSEALHGDVISVAHYYEQNGDLMADPDMNFLVSDVDGEVYPLSFRMDGTGINWEGVQVIDGKVMVALRLQRDHATFAGTWMRNIKDQQGL